MRIYCILSIFFILTPYFILPNLVAANTMTPDELREQNLIIYKHESNVEKAFNKNLDLSAKKDYIISAKSYGAFDVLENKTIIVRRKDQALSIASITKLMNAVVAKENIKSNPKITLTTKMLNSEGQSPSIYNGLKISFEDLLKASLTQSVNDAAKSISFFVGEKKFITLMNKKAKELGMKNTVFVDTNGLSLKNKSTTADLYKLVSYVYKNHPELLEITKANDFWLPDKDGKVLKFYNTNFFYNQPEFIGGKTGYLPEVGQNIASVFNINGKPIIVITLNSKNQQADTLAILNKLKK